MFTAQATSADLAFTGSAKVMERIQAPVSTTYTADDTNMHRWRWNRIPIR